MTKGIITLQFIQHVGERRFSEAHPFFHDFAQTTSFQNNKVFNFFGLISSLFHKHTSVRQFAVSLKDTYIILSI